MIHDEKRDQLDDLFQKKLYDFERQSLPGNWEEIAGKLATKRIIPFYHRTSFRVAAAVALLFTITGMVYFLRETPPALADGPITEEQVSEPIRRVGAQTETFVAQESMVAVKRTKKIKKLPPPAATVSDIMEEKTCESNDEEEEEGISPEERVVSVHRRTEVADYPATKRPKVAGRWSLGVSAGGFLAQKETGIALQEIDMADDFLSLRPPVLLFASLPGTIPETNDEPPSRNLLRHAQPISFGLSLSRQLSSHLALVTGLTYSYLSSEWETGVGKDYRHEVQNLHFVGIPLSLQCTVAERQRWRFYTSAGTMTEMNVLGRASFRNKLEDGTFSTATTEKRRMKEWLWSLSATGGVSYLLTSPVSAYGEVGAAYYFDNGSKVETIRSQQRFNVLLQIGLRFGF